MQNTYIDEPQRLTASERRWVIIAEKMPEGSRQVAGDIRRQLAGMRTTTFNTALRWAREQGYVARESLTREEWESRPRPEGAGPFTPGMFVYFITEEGGRKALDVRRRLDRDVAVAARSVDDPRWMGEDGP